MRFPCPLGAWRASDPPRRTRAGKAAGRGGGLTGKVRAPKDCRRKDRYTLAAELRGRKGKVALIVAKRRRFPSVSASFA